MNCDLFVYSQISDICNKICACQVLNPKSLMWNNFRGFSFYALNICHPSQMQIYSHSTLFMISWKTNPKDLTQITFCIVCFFEEKTAYICLGKNFVCEVDSSFETLWYHS